MDDKQLVEKLRQKYMQNPPEGELSYKAKKAPKIILRTFLRTSTQIGMNTD
ncbi:MAG: hypothetical protein Q4D54_02760 [Eubacteriales bacterium]|nr:hypothetical protein [Eubacteriales bacterium]